MVLADISSPIRSWSSGKIRGGMKTTVVTAHSPARCCLRCTPCAVSAQQRRRLLKRAAFNELVAVEDVQKETNYNFKDADLDLRTPQSLLPQRYPFVDSSTRGVEMLRAEPPVLLIHNFLSNAECDSLVAAASAGLMREASYGDAVLLDYSKLWPLIFIITAGCVPTALHSLEDGLPLFVVVQHALGAFLAWTFLVAALVGGVRSMVEKNIQGKVFTGSKWTASDLKPGSPSWTAYQRFSNRLASLLGISTSCLELPTITRYRTGEFQRVHMDARPIADSEGSEEFMKAGGQRLVQCVVYLNTLDPEQGGATAFHHPALGKLAVQPRKGAALVFFPAFRDGNVDQRMAHSGQVVKAGEKWIINTWAMQFERPQQQAAAPEYYYG